MLVATTMLPRWPAPATTCASTVSLRAFSTAWRRLFRVSSALKISDWPTERVPTSTGRPAACNTTTRSSTACHLAVASRSTRVGCCTRWSGQCEATRVVGSRYTACNSPRTSRAVPVMPASNR